MSSKKFFQNEDLFWRARVWASALAISFTSGAFAQTPTLTQFSLQGPLESFKLASPGNPLSGATIKVQGVTVTVPSNLIVQMPATYLTPQQIFGRNPEGAGNSGLAADDTPPPLAVAEVNIVGNIVNGNYIAGLVCITQHSLANGAGYIRAINPTNGELTIGPKLGDSPTPPTASLARVRINDPKGIYAPTATPGATYDPRFTIDLENPSVHASTGYPMCVPVGSATANCFAGNRPSSGGAPLFIFVMDTADLNSNVAGAAIITACPGCDPSKMAPLAVGDFVTYAGKVQRDGASSYISAYQLNANVAIYTKPNVDPAYVMIEESLIGTMGPTVDAAGNPVNIEAQDRLKIEGFLTDPARVIDVYAIDKSSAGVETLRYLTTSPAQPSPFGRYRQVLGSRANALFDNLPGPLNTLKGAPRELMVALRAKATSAGPFDGVLKDNALAAFPTTVSVPGELELKAGVYTAPIGEFIFPENTVAGEPVVPNNFECMPWLLFGSGPLDPDTAGSPVVGPLNPWPGEQIAGGGAKATSTACGPKPKAPRLGGGGGAGPG